VVSRRGGDGLALPPPRLAGVEAFMNPISPQLQTIMYSLIRLPIIAMLVAADKI
jgi:hypothetical protein